MTTSLVVAIEPDREQAARLSAIVRTRLGAELVLADSVARALTALGDRVPDLILTPALMSTRDESALSARLRELGAAAAHVQTVTVPRIGGARAGTEEAGLFKRFRRSRPAPAAADGCEPDVFAQQVSDYLQRARAERRAALVPPIAAVLAEEVIAAPTVVEPAAAPMFMEAVEPMPVFEPVMAVADLPVIVPVAAAADLPVIEPGMAAADLPVIEPVIAAADLAIMEPVIVPADLPGIEQMTVRAAIEELTASAPVEVEEVAVGPLMIEPAPAPAPVEVDEIASGPVMVEDTAPTPLTVDELVLPRVIEVKEIAAAPLVVEDPVPPPMIEVKACAARPAIAPEILAPLVAAPLEDDQFHIAAQDFGDVDMSTLLDGLVLPEAAAPEADPPKTEAAAPLPPPEPAEEPEPVLPPLPARRMLPPRRPLPAHDRSAEPKAARRRVKPPVQDEWGLFDPEQCGFAALLAKLDAVTEDEEMNKRRGTQARVISYT